MMMMVMMMMIMSDQCFNSPYCYTTQSKKGGEQKDEDEGDDNDENKSWLLNKFCLWVPREMYVDSMENMYAKTMILTSRVPWHESFNHLNHFTKIGR